MFSRTQKQKVTQHMIVLTISILQFAEFLHNFFWHMTT